MFLEQNKMEWETLNLPDLELAEKANIPENLPPPHRRTYSKEDEDAIRAYIESGLLSGFLRKIDSPYASPLLVVSKPGTNKKRVCTDARLINKELLEPVCYPLPTVTDILNRIGRNTIFTALDARNAFNQIRLSERSQKLVAFATYLDGIRGTYAPIGMPFGINTGPAYYQKTIDGVCHKFKRPNSDVDSYIDDMTLGSRASENKTDKENHIQDLDILLNRLSSYGFKLKLEKCKFMQTTVEICGFELSGGGYRPSEKHRKLLMNLKPFSVLDNTKNAMLRYLGKVGYHRRFGGKDYAKLEKELRDLVSKYENKSISADEADGRIKEISDKITRTICETQLIIPSEKDEIHLNSDASKTSWGAVMYVPNKGTVSYHGGTFSKRIINTYSIFGKEILGLLNGLEINKELIIRAPKVTCNVDNLAAVMSSTTYKHHTKPTDIINIMKIQQFISLCRGSVIIKHCAGSSNLVADFLSRLIYEADDKPVGQMAAIQYETKNKNDTDKIFIPKVGVLEIDLNKDEIDQEEYWKLKRDHESHHLSFEKTLALLKERDRERNRKLIKRIIQECPNCTNKLVKIAPYGKLSMKPVPYRPFYEVDVDFAIPPINSSAGHTAILTARCEFSRYFSAYPMKTRSINEVTNNLDALFRNMGNIPNVVCMDNEFNVSLIQTWAETNNFKVHFRCSNSSRSIGVERAHRSMWDQWEKVMFNQNPRSWHTMLNKIIDPLNKAPNAITGVSPYKVVFGIPPIKIAERQIPGNTDEIKRRNQLYQMVYEKTKEHRKSYSSDHKWPILQPGEEVIIKYQGGKKGKEKHGVVLEYSGEDSPRVDVKCEGDKKCSQLGIHKGQIYKRKVPLSALFDKDHNMNESEMTELPLSENGMRSDEVKSSKQGSLRSSCNVSPVTQIRDIKTWDEVQNLESIDQEKAKDARVSDERPLQRSSKRNRKVPDRLGY